MTIGLLERGLGDETRRAGHDDAFEVVAARGRPFELESGAALLELLARAIDLRQALDAEKVVERPLPFVLVRAELVVSPDHV